MASTEGNEGGGVEVPQKAGWLERARRPMSDETIQWAAAIGFIAFSLIGLEGLLTEGVVDWMFPLAFAIGVLQVFGLVRDRRRRARREAASRREKPGV